jgi:hypothetical protein
VGIFRPPRNGVRDCSHEAGGVERETKTRHGNGRACALGYHGSEEDWPSFIASGRAPITGEAPLNQFGFSEQFGSPSVLPI